jgi:hypothetical protein
MRGEREVLAVHVRNQVGDTDRCLHIRVGQVAPEPDGVATVVAAAVTVMPGRRQYEPRGDRRGKELLRPSA